MHPDDPACGTCDSSSQPGPVREAGGTTGAGNAQPMSRTGGATGGVNHGPAAARPATTTDKHVDPQQDPGAPKAPGNAPDPNFAAGDHGPIKGAKHPEEVPRPAKTQEGGTAGPRRTSDQR